MKNIPDKSIDLILQDPPYNTTACKWEWDIMKNIDEFWYEWKRIIKDNGAIVMTANQPFTSKLVMSNMKMFKYEWIWIKDKPSNFLMGKRMPMKYTESVLVFSKERTKYNPQMIKREEKNKRNNKLTSSLLKCETYGYDVKNNKYQDRLLAGIRDELYPRNYLFFSKRGKSTHPTQKPISLFEYFIKTYTNEGDTVFDGFIGSGTTAIACINTKRDYIGFELDKTYFDIANKCIAEHVKQQEFKF